MTGPDLEMMVSDLRVAQVSKPDFAFWVAKKSSSERVRVVSCSLRAAFASFVCRNELVFPGLDPGVFIHDVI